MLQDTPGGELVERAEDLILRLRDIQSCRITTDETGAITEIHVVASTDKPPKMIARDVETILKAELGLNIDYRKIGVVLIDSARGMSFEEGAGPNDEPVDSRQPSVEEIFRDQLAGPGARKPVDREESLPETLEPKLEFLEEDVRIRFNGLRISMDESSVDIEVKLEKNGIGVVGCTGALRKSGPIHEVIAGATIHAVMELLDEDFHLCLSGIEEIDISGSAALVSVVDLIEGRVVRSFPGCVFIGRDQNEAAVLSVLDALNRPLGKWESRKEIHYTIR